jgi:prepilin-type N-terminal cleavage/methylation domain-containing protein
MKRQHTKRGFTLIELITVIGIVIVLSAMGYSQIDEVFKNVRKGALAQIMPNVRTFVEGLITKFEDSGTPFIAFNCSFKSWSTAPFSGPYAELCTEFGRIAAAGNKRNYSAFLTASINNTGGITGIKGSIVHCIGHNKAVGTTIWLFGQRNVGPGIRWIYNSPDIVHFSAAKDILEFTASGLYACD